MVEVYSGEVIAALPQSSPDDVAAAYAAASPCSGGCTS
jgi:hypothetical protein